MTQGIDSANSTRKNIFNKDVPKAPKSVATGAVIGGAVGAASQLAWVGALMPKQLTQDEFTKQLSSSVSENIKNSLDPEQFAQIAKDRYEEYLKKFPEEIAKIKKQIPSSVLKSAGALAIVGAGIGAIVHFVKKSKASKEEQAQVQNLNQETK